MLTATSNTLSRVNSFHVDILAPLVKWKILSLRKLRVMSGYQGKINSFERIVRRMESNGVISSFIEPMSRSKYIYLTRIGSRLIGMENYTDQSKETLFHDSKVTEVCNEFMKLDCFNSVKLEHEISSLNSILPDAILSGSKDDKKFRIALELEITQKSKARIIEKITDYRNSIEFDYALYLFSSDAIYKNYKRCIEENIGKNIWNKVIFFSLPSLLDGECRLENATGYFDNQEIKLHDVF